MCGLSWKCLEDIPSVFVYLKMSQILSYFWRPVFLGAQTLMCIWRLPFALWPGQAALSEHPFSIAVVMSYQEVRGLKHHNLGFHGVRAWKSEVGTPGRESRCWQLPCFLEAREETCIPPIFHPHFPPLRLAVTGWSSSRSILTQSSACSSTEDDPSEQSRTLFPSKGSELAAFILFVALIPLCCEIAHLQVLDADIF